MSDSRVQSKVHNKLPTSVHTGTVSLPGILRLFLAVGGAVDSYVCGGVGESVGRRKRDDGSAVTRELQPRPASRATIAPRRRRAWTVLG
jgi:hypothetical protein